MIAAKLFFVRGDVLYNFLKSFFTGESVAAKFVEVFNMEGAFKDDFDGLDVEEVVVNNQNLFVMLCVFP